MYLLIFLFIFALGTIIGSFLNVVIFRFNTGRTIVKGRSMCMTCSNTLRWYELIPLFSWLIQSGKCRRCAAKISHQYPIVEFITGVVFTLITFKFFPILYYSFWSYFFSVLFFALIFSLLIVISVYDIRHKIIPDKLVFVFIALSFISIFINYSGMGSFFVFPNILTILSGPILAIPFGLIWLFSKGRLMGLGDAKLLLGVGWLFGLAPALCAVILSFWIGTVVSLLVMLFSKKKMNMKTEIPFAPFIIIATFITFLFNLDIFSLVSLF